MGAIINFRHDDDDTIEHMFVIRVTQRTTQNALDVNIVADVAGWRESVVEHQRLVCEEFT